MGQWVPKLCSPCPVCAPWDAYLGRARVLLVQQVVLPALVLVLLVIDFQLLSHGFHAVLFHHLVLPYTQPQSGPAPALQQPPCKATGPKNPHQPCRVPHRATSQHGEEALHLPEGQDDGWPWFGLSLQHGPHLLVLGDGVEQPRVQLGVVLGERLVPVMRDELHHRAKSQGLRETVLPFPVKDLDQLVIASFPAEGRGERRVVITTAGPRTRLDVSLCASPMSQPPQARGHVLRSWRPT